MTTEAESGATSETYFWLGIHHSNKWKFVDGTEAIIRNTHKPQSDGPVGAFVLGKRQESVNCISDNLDFTHVKTPERNNTKFSVRVLSKIPIFYIIFS